MDDTAASIMTRHVVSVGPATAMADIAVQLIKHGISAVPVIDAGGKLLGIVSEGDLLAPFSAKNQARRSWWLDILAEGETLAPEFVQYISLDHHTAVDLMSKPPITALENTTIPELAELLMKSRIKRVPIMRDGGVVGIVSRADIVRALARRSGADGGRLGSSILRSGIGTGVA